MKISFVILSLVLCVTSYGQNKDSVQLREIYDHVLTEGRCYENLHDLCKSIGHRLSGSSQAEKAVAWGKLVLERYNPDRVYLQEVMVPHWVRGDVERLDFSNNINKLYQAQCTALGGSVGTNGGVLKANVVEIKTWDELEKIGKKGVEGKVVFFNRPMNPTLISTFRAYGGCVDQRHSGAAKASEYGAVGVIVRSMTLKKDKNPHTGSMGYGDAKVKVPAVAISTVDAHNLSEMLKQDKNTEIRLKLSCETLPDVKSHNVIAEIKGTEFPDEIIAFGGHLDSWDIGEGAHDDGAGVVQSMEVIKTFMSLGIRPKRTIRCILFMNEENGNRGGKTYAEMAAKEGEKHVMALETDRGGFSPKGFDVDGTEEELKHLKQFESLFLPYQLYFVNPGYGGVDIGPLKKTQKTCLVGLHPDSQRYFDFHHAPTDVFETVNKRELELGAAAMSSLIYLVDQYGMPVKE